MKLDVLKFYLVLLILRLGLFLFSLFLIFGDFEPRCSNKIVLIKKRVYGTRLCTFRGLNHSLEMSGNRQKK